jgi:hypothetical protein
VRRLERRLQLGDPLGVLPGQLAEIPLAAEAVELEILASADRRAEALHHLHICQLRVPLVDRTQVEVGLQPRVMPVVLVVELRDEAVGAGAVAVELAVAGRLLLKRGVGHAP